MHPVATRQVTAFTKFALKQLAKAGVRGAFCQLECVREVSIKTMLQQPQCCPAVAGCCRLLQAVAAGFGRILVIDHDSYDRRP